MRTTTARLGAVVLTAALLSGCAKIFPYVSALDSEKRYLEKDSTVLTEADKRAIINVNQMSAQHGMVVPDRIVCAEPSPDVAKALSEGISLALAADIQGQGSGELQGSRSFAESIAQLGERLGTIQLLRDGFYRACEAYANGAISDTTYAMIVSGTDDVMATLMASEMAAGAFGRQQAAIAGQATASTTAVIANQDAVQRHEEEIVKLETRRAELDEQIKNEKDAAEKQKLETEREGVESAIEERRQLLRDAIQRSASSSARATIASGIGSISHAPQATGPLAVERIHRNFMRSTNIDAFMKACVTTLDRRDSRNNPNQVTPFARVCRAFFGLDGKLQEKSPFNLILKAAPGHTERMAMIEAFPADLLAEYVATCTGEVKEADEPTCESLKEVLQTFTKLASLHRS